MTLTEHFALALPFEPGAATAPSSGISAIMTTLWGYAAWVVPVIACFALVGAAIAFFKHRDNGNNEGATKTAWIMGGCVFFGFIPTLVGAVTGT